MPTEKSLLWALLLIVAVVLLAPLAMMLVMMPMMGFWGWGQMGMGPGMGDGGGWMWLLVVAVIGAAGYLVYRGVRRVDQGDPALEELRLAYARGELTDEEFEERRERLRREA